MNERIGAGKREVGVRDVDGIAPTGDPEFPPPIFTRSKKKKKPEPWPMGRRLELGKALCSEI